MSNGGVNAVGSVVAMMPADGGWWVMFDGDDTTSYAVIGWAIVVVGRDMWVVTTQVQPVVAVDGAIGPVGGFVFEKGTAEDKTRGGWRGAWRVLKESGENEIRWNGGGGNGEAGL